MSYVYLTVGRVIDQPDRRDVAKKLDDDSPRAKEHHVQRSRALHDVLDGDSLWTVKDRATTDDEQPHDHVELRLELKKGCAK